MHRALPAALACLSLACAAYESSFSGTDCGGGPCTGAQKSWWVSRNTGRITEDVLIVVDSNVTTGPHSKKLEEVLRLLEEGLDFGLAFDLSWDDLAGRDTNLALVAAATDDQTRLWPSTPACSGPSGPFLHASRLCEAPSNFVGEVGNIVSCTGLHMPALGERPRPAQTLRALLSPGGIAETSGFRRKDAYLVVAIISAEDDPDFADPAIAAELRAILGAVGSDAVYTVGVGIVAPTSARGLVDFARSLGSSGVYNDIDNNQWSAVSMLTGSFHEGTNGTACADVPLADADPSQPGLQPDCTVKEQHLLSDRWGDPILLPPCSAEGSISDTCWKVVEHEPRCRGSGQRLLIGSPPATCRPSYAIKNTFTCAIDPR